MQTEGGGDELGQSNGPSSTSVPEEQNDKNKTPEINDDDFDLDALAEALEQAATLASNSKKKNKSKHANAPVKRPVVKEQACDLSIPGEDKFERTRYHVCKI
jgi:pre-rRNA-processing protein TSR4